MIKEAVILAGGLGTRLRSAVADLPKSMAPVNGIPFIHFIVSYLESQGVEKFVFALGYMNEIVTAYLDNNFKHTCKKYSIEKELLGTGGAIKIACASVENENVLVLNGDTLFNIDTAALTAMHETNQADCTVALKPMKDFSRYGSVELNTDNSINSFREKRYCEKGYINGGVYILNVPSFVQNELPPVFSFEKWLEQNAGTKKLYGNPHDNYFIDIGIPGDYLQFCEEYNRILAAKEAADGTTVEPSSLIKTFLNHLD